MSLITFRISGSAYLVIAEGSWPQDNARGWAAVRGGTKRSAGRGYQVTVTMTDDDAKDLVDYLRSIAEVNEGMTAAEREGDSSHKHARRAIAAIEAALPSLGERYRDRVTADRTLTPADQDAISDLLQAGGTQ